MGTYQTGIAILGQQDQQLTQQSSATDSATPKRKVCGKCGQHGHITWRAKACRRHSEYISSKKRIPNKNRNTTNTQPVEDDDAKKVRTDGVGERLLGDVDCGSFARTAKTEAIAAKASIVVPFKN